MIRHILSHTYKFKPMKIMNPDRHYFSMIDSTKITPLNNNIIKNKQNIMKKIRTHIKQSFTESNNGDEYYIGLVHTYPAWIGFFSLQKISMQSHSAQNPYGHTLVEFFHFKNNMLNSDFVMNVGTQTPFSSNNFINFFDSSEYYLNNNDENINEQNFGNHQNGLLERSFITINIRVTEQVWFDMINSYKHLQCRCQNQTQNQNQNQLIRFSLLTHLFTNILRRHNIYKFSESGNCTYWTTSVFRNHGMLSSQHSFPMVAFYKFLLNIELKLTNYFSSQTEYSIILYKGVKHNFLPKGSLLYPFYWINNGYSKIWEVEKTAHSIVELNDNYDDVKISEQNVKTKLSKFIEFLKTIF